MKDKITNEIKGIVEELFGKKPSAISIRDNFFCERDNLDKYEVEDGEIYGFCIRMTFNSTTRAVSNDEVNEAFSRIWMKVTRRPICRNEVVIIVKSIHGYRTNETGVENYYCALYYGPSEYNSNTGEYPFGPIGICDDVIKKVPFSWVREWHKREF